jgi:hypothetical protein
VPLDFGAVAATQGRRDFSGYDGLVVRAARADVTILFTLTGCPAWACPTGAAPTAGAALTAWKGFVAAAVARYGATGTVWTANPSVPRRPVTAWQVGNEVNGANALWPTPDPVAYGTFLATTAASIRGADAGAKVVLSGLPEKMKIWMKDYLAALYRQPAFKASVDVIAVHGYAVAPADTARILDTARTIMLANGDGATPLWITEMSWATGGPPFPFLTTEAGQAANLRSAWDTQVACRGRWNLQRTYWYAYQDRALLGAADYWGFHDGLLRLDGTAKPALAAFHEFTSGATLPGGRGTTCSLPGGLTIDTTPPDTTISGLPARTADTAPAARFGSTEAGVRYECHLAGLPWATCAPGADGLWRPAAALAQGAYTLDVRAVDAQGNVDPTPARAAFVVDTTPPDTYVSGTWGVVAGRTVSLSLSANEPVRGYECRVDAAVWAPCTSPFTTTLPAGNHTISVRAVDQAGLADPYPAVPWYTVA